MKRANSCNGEVGASDASSHKSKVLSALKLTFLGRMIQLWFFLFCSFSLALQGQNYGIVTLTLSSHGPHPVLPNITTWYDGSIAAALSHRLKRDDYPFHSSLKSIRKVYAIKSTEKNASQNVRIKSLSHWVG